MTGHSLALGSATTILAVSASYLIVLVVGITRTGWDTPITDPVLAIMELLTILSAPPLATLSVAMLERAPPARRSMAMVAVVFAALFAGTTCAVHFTGLTAGRQMGGGLLVWPSVAYALELLAWDVFLGVTLLAMAASIDERTHTRAARSALRVTAVLCLLGTVGPVIGDMRLQRIGVLGYAVGLPVAVALLRRMLSHEGEPPGP